jgi:hypothetical protein
MKINNRILSLQVVEDKVIIRQKNGHFVTFSAEEFYELMKHTPQITEHLKNNVKNS